MKKSKYTWEDQRTDIQRTINEYFGRSIQIEPRAMASFQCGESVDSLNDTELTGVYEYSIIHSMLKCSPAISSTLFKLGVEIEKMKFPITLDHPAPLSDNALDFIFRGIQLFGFGPLVESGKKVMKSGVLNEIDLLLASLQSSIAGTETNTLGSAIMESRGIEVPTHIKGEIVNQTKRWNEIDSYLMHLIEGVEEIWRTDPSHSLIQFVLFIDDHSKIRIRPFGTIGVGTLEASPPLTVDQKYIYRGGILQPINTLIRNNPQVTFDEFEDLLNSKKATENDLQRFFEKNPFLLLGLDFSKAHPQPILYKDDGSKLVPDFFLEKMSSRWHTILDLKLPYNEMVIRRKNRTYFRNHVQNAIAQLHYYRDWFESKNNRKKFAEIYGISVFRPKMVIVIGRNHHFINDVERINLLERLPQNLELWTYDEILNRARKCIDLFF